MRDLQADLQNLLPEIMASPRLYVHTLDLDQNAALIIDADQQFYRNAASLDQSSLSADTKGARVSLDVVWRHMDAAARNYLAPANFIFHTGHCGATQISRLLDELPSILGVREPMMLRTLATGLHARTMTGGGAFEETFKRAYQLLVRRFSPKQHVIIKPSSTCNNLAPVLLAQNPANRGLLVFVTLEIFLASMLESGDATGIDDLMSHRVASLKKIVPDLELNLTTLSLPEKIAFAWLVEATQLHILSTRGLASRVLLMDFDRFLADTEVQLREIVRHFGIPAEPSVIDGLRAGQVFKSGSEQPEFTCAPADRKAILDESRATNAAAIRSGMGFVERMMKIHPDLGELTENIPLG